MNRQGFLLSLITPVFVLACGFATAQENTDYSQSSTWRFEFANDLIVDSDNQFTNGFSIQKHGPLASSLDETGGTAAIGKRLARFFLPDSEGLYYREAWSFGQNMQSPDDIENPDIILNDLPYVGMIGWHNSFIAFNDQSLTGFGWMIGAVGENSFAEDVQKAVHKMTGAAEPQGWEHQLDNEPLLSLFYTKKKKLWRKTNFDGAVSFNAALSNFVTYGEVGLEMRFGRMPEGFAYVPDPIGRGLSYHAMLPAKDESLFYGTLIVRGTGFLVDMLREGNTFVDDNEWTENNILDPKDFTAQVYAGIHYERRSWALRFNFWYGSGTVDTDVLPPEQDPENSGGTIVYEWRFD